MTSTLGVVSRTLRYLILGNRKQIADVTSLVYASHQSILERHQKIFILERCLIQKLICPNIQEDSKHIVRLLFQVLSVNEAAKAASLLCAGSFPHNCNRLVHFFVSKGYVQQILGGCVVLACYSQVSYLCNRINSLWSFPHKSILVSHGFRPPFARSMDCRSIVAML